MKKSKWLGVALVIVFSACGSSKITSSWKAPDATPKKYNKVLVLGLVRENDRSLQESMENHFVGDLGSLGYQAVSSLKEYGPRAFDKIDEESAVQKLNSKNVDAVLTIVLLDKAKEGRYLPAKMQYSPVGDYYNRFWDYKTVLNQRIYEPGYYVTDTRYFWESNLYDLNSKKLIFSIQTESFAPANSESMGHEYGRMIVKKMVREKVLDDFTTTSIK